MKPIPIAFALVLVLSAAVPNALRAAPPFPVPGPPSAPGLQPQGFSVLLCLADALLGGASLSNDGDTIVLFGGQVIIEATSDVSTVNGVSDIDVRITHGESFSDHTARFIDDGDGALDCGDTIVAVT